MIKVDAEYKEKMKESRNFKAVAEITFADGTEITLDSSQFTASNNSITDGAGVSSFPIGVAVQKIIQLEIFNDELQFSDYNFLGAKINLHIHFDVGGYDEVIDKGTYTVITPETYGDTIIITAYDDMYKADRDYYTVLTFPQRARALLLDLCAFCKISLSNTDFLHNDFLIENKPTGKCRDIIGYIAMIACGNARFNANNKLEIISYDFTGWEDEEKYHVLNEFTSPKIEYNDTAITGFKMVVKDSQTNEEKTILEGDETYCVTVQNPLINSGSEKTLLSWLFERLGNVPFRPFSGDAIANPLVEFMDLAKVQDRRGNLYNTFITDVSFLIPGYTNIKNSTPSMSKYNLSYSSNSSKVEQKVLQFVEVEKSEREAAVERLSEALTDASGLYYTEEIQPNHSKIRYLHDKPDREGSQLIIKLTDEGIGISNDSGKTYPWGLTFTGEAILDLIYAVGINCSYLNSGAITVKDDNGNIIFQVDIDSKRVEISGDSITIGGKSLEKRLEESTSLNMVLSNEYTGIPVDSNGNYEGSMSVSTTVQVFYGHENVTDECSFSGNNSSGVYGNLDKDTHTYTVTGLTLDSGWVDITATYLGLYKVTKRFTISKTKDGVDGSTYFLSFEPANVLKKGQDNVLSPTYISCYAYSIPGDTEKRLAYYGRFKIETTKNNSTYTTVYTSSSNEASHRMSLSSIDSDVVALRFTLYKSSSSTSSNENVLDIQTVPIVVDVSALTHEQIFNLLTNNGQIQGLFKEGNQIYINAAYIKADTFDGYTIKGSEFLNEFSAYLNASTIIEGYTKINSQSTFESGYADISFIKIDFNEYSDEITGRQKLSNTVYEFTPFGIDIKQYNSTGTLINRKKISPDSGPYLKKGPITFSSGTSTTVTIYGRYLEIEVANASERGRKYERFPKGLNATRNIVIGYSAETAVYMTLEVTWSGYQATVRCTRFYASGDWSLGTSQILYFYDADSN